MSDESLQAWALRTLGDKSEGWDGACGRQVMFLRDTLAYLVCGNLDYDDRQEQPRLISTHRSKSVTLPVVAYERPDIGLRVVLRNNFYNWKMSVVSEKPITADFSGLFYTTPPIAPDYTGNELADCYFEGFPSDSIFGYFSENPRRFSAQIGTHEQLWAALFLIMRDIGEIGPRVWHTEASHRVALDAQTAKKKTADARRKAVRK